MEDKREIVLFFGISMRKGGGIAGILYDYRKFERSDEVRIHSVN